MKKKEDKDARRKFLKNSLALGAAALAAGPAASLAPKSETGNSAEVDDSGLKALVSVSHFSTYAVMQPYSAAQLFARQAVKDLVTENPFVLSEYQISPSPDIPLLEGLSPGLFLGERADHCGTTSTLSASADWSSPIDSPPK